MKFSDIPGHEDIKARLREMADSGHIPHALLLEGPAGSAKFALARAFAAYIHCTNRHDGDSCGVCEACLQHQSFNNIDTFYSFPVIKKNSKPSTSDDYFADFKEFATQLPFMDFEAWLEILGNVNAQPMIYVEEATRLLERSNLKARRARYKIVLMWLPERLNEEAANKLLKLVEEPYPDTLFVMSSDNPAAILPTIYSRTQRIPVRRYSDAEVSRFLQSKSIDAAQADSLAALADGSLSQALRLASPSKKSGKYLSLFIELMRLAYQRKVGDLRRWSEKIAEMGREGCSKFYEYSSRMARDNFVMNLNESELVAMSAEERQFSVKFSPFINERNIVDISSEFDKARNDVLANGNAKIIAFDLAIKMIMLLRR